MKSDNPLGVKSRITTFHACPRLVSILERGANGCRAGCGGSMVLVVYCTFLLTVAPDQGGGAASTLSMTNGNKQERTNKQCRKKQTKKMFLDAGTYQSSLRVLMQTQKWCEEKTRSTLETQPRRMPSSPCRWSTPSTRGC